MISIHVSPIINMQKESFKDDLVGYADQLKEKLVYFLFHKTVKELWQVKYINQMIYVSKEIITARPSELLAWRITFDQICDSKIVEADIYMSFRSALLYRMGYSDRRSDFYPSYFQKMGIRSCVYCNSQFALVVDCKKFAKGKRDPETLAEAKFQLDHFLAKSQYPCFSISLFNLYPVCATCNNIKGGLEVNFQLYNEEDNKINVSKYQFSLKNGCVADYLTNNFSTETLEIIFEDPDKPDQLRYGDKSISDTFDIKGIYDTQIDIVEELIHRRRIYNTSYRETLVKSFPDLFNHSSLSERTLLGNYHLPEDIHKRPMAKFMQDIDNHLKGIIDTELP